MHKIDKHTGLYLEWDGPYHAPVSEGVGTFGDGDSALAKRIVDYLSQTKWYFKQGIKSSVIHRLGSWAEPLYKEELEVLVYSYPYVFLSVLKDEQGVEL